MSTPTRAQRPGPGGSSTGPDGAPTSGRGALAPVLLTDASWYGTLAAARELGSRGVPVVLATDAAIVPARWSRFVSRTIRCPSTKEPDRFVEFLHEFGDREPGHVYYPTSDDAAWLVSANGLTLGARYRLYTPPLSALEVLLDKGLLEGAGRSSGLDVPDTWCPSTEEELTRLAPSLPFPLMMKARTQVLSPNGRKGLTIRRRDELVPAWTAWRHQERPRHQSAAPHPGAGLPVLQRSHRADERVYTIDGFIDRAGRSAMLGCRKLLQHPRRAGAGIVFEPAPIDPALAAGLVRLLRSVGFHGIFDAEFLAEGERQLLIDVNPRIYNHMAFESDRGLPLAWLAYLGATGDEQGLGAALTECAGQAAAPAAQPRAYACRRSLRIMLALQRLSGAMTSAERRAWSGWLTLPAGAVTDPVASPADPWPARIDVLVSLMNALRHPRSQLRGYTSSGT